MRLNADWYEMLATEVGREKDGSMVIHASEEHWNLISNMRSGELLIPAGGSHPPGPLMSRFLSKIALEAMAHRLLKNRHLLDEFIDDTQLDPLRRWGRYGEPQACWPVSQRTLYDASRLHADVSGNTFQCLHEFDFLFTDVGEVYFCLAIFGIEYTINVIGPSLDGFEDWLLKHNYVSPLYAPKRTFDL